PPSLLAQDSLRALRAWSKVDPEQKPAPHRQRCMNPFHLFRSQFGMRLIQLHPWDIHVPDHLLMMGLGTLGRPPLKAIHGLEVDVTDIRGAFVTDAPPLTLQKPFHGRFRQLAPRHQGALPLGELPVAEGTAQPFDVLGRACPGAMRDVPGTGAIEPCTLWIRTREASITLLGWRRQCHVGPPLAENGPKDTERTPVFPRYSSPGLSDFVCSALSLKKCPKY